MPYTTNQSELAEVQAGPQSFEIGKTVRTLASNSGSNVIRIALTSLVSILLPVYLTHHLSVQVYGAWVLILQLGAYIGYLNLGVQTALAKYIAEYQATQDQAGCNQCTSVGLLIMAGACVLGLILTGLLVVIAPRLFGDLPPRLLHDVRISVIFVGVSLSLGLVSSIFSAIFLGLQRYHIPMAISVASRILYAGVVCAAMVLHHGLIWMAVGAAAVNLITSLAEVLAWRHFASFIGFSLFSISTAMLKKMAAYCSILTVWSACMLFIGGLDVTIVAHYAFREVAFYSIAGAPTNMILTIIGAVLGPLLPAASAISVTSSPLQMGNLLLRSTRYSTVLLLTTGLPVMVGGYVLLRLWVGPIYAVRSVLFLHVLLLANIIRNLCAPYATVVVATSRQHVATASAVTEGLVNLAASILLARHFGAIGVALGTLIGALAGVAMHFGISMHYTQTTFAVSRTRLFLEGFLRPGVMVLPSLLLAPFWWRALPASAPAITWVFWCLSTAMLACFVSLSSDDRRLIRLQASSLLRRSPQPTPLNGEV